MILNQFEQPIYWFELSRHSSNLSEHLNQKIWYLKLVRTTNPIYWFKLSRHSSNLSANLNQKICLNQFEQPIYWFKLSRHSSNISADLNQKILHIKLVGTTNTGSNYSGTLKVTGHSKKNLQGFLYQYKNIFGISHVLLNVRVSGYLDLKIHKVSNIYANRRQIVKFYI